MNKLRILPEYFLFVFLFLSSFNLNGVLAEIPLTHAEIAYIEWVAQSQEVEEEHQFAKTDASSFYGLASKDAYAAFKTDILQSLLIQQQLALIGFQRQKNVFASIIAQEPKSGEYLPIHYSSEKPASISIS